MTKDTAPLDTALGHTTVGNQSDIYNLVAAWHKSLSTAIERSGGNRYRRVFNEYFKKVAEHVTLAATSSDGTDIDWDFLEDFIDAYPPGAGEMTCASPIIADAVARGIVRTRLHTDVDSIPTSALEYCAEIETEPDGDTAWELSRYLGFGIGHAEYDVGEQIYQFAAAGKEPRAHSCISLSFLADQDLTVDVIERVAKSNETIESFIFIGAVTTHDRRAKHPARGVHPLNDTGHHLLSGYTLPYTFEFSDHIRQRLRTLLIDLGYGPARDDDWELADMPEY